MGGFFIFVVIVTAIGVGAWAWVTNGLLAYANSELARVKTELARLEADDLRLIHTLQQETKRQADRVVLNHLPRPWVRQP